MRSSACVVPSIDQGLDQVRNKFWVVLFGQMVDRRLFDTQLFQIAAQGLPVFFALLALGKIEFRDQLLSALERDLVTVLVVILDDPLLVFGVVRHHRLVRLFESAKNQ